MRRRRIKAHGQSLAELAVCLPVLVVLLFACCQLALIGQAACFTHLAAMRAARAYAVYCQKGPGFGLAMAGQAAALAVERCRPRPEVTVELEEDPGTNDGGGSSDGTRQAAAMATGMTGLKDKKKDETLPLFIMKAEVRYPLLFPMVRGLFGDRPSLTLVGRASLAREDSADYFTAHPEIKKSES